MLITLCMFILKYLYCARQNIQLYRTCTELHQNEASSITLQHANNNNDQHSMALSCLQSSDTQATKLFQQLQNVFQEHVIHPDESMISNEKSRQGNYYTLYSVSQTNYATLVLGITLANAGRFSHFFSLTDSAKNCSKQIVTFPTSP